MIIPAILTDKCQTLIEMVNVCKEFTDYVQIDIMDGIFVPSRSITVKDLNGLALSVKSEAHLMVKEPLKWLEAFKRLGSQRIIYHFEIKAHHPTIIEAIRKMRFEVGLAINPRTTITDIQSLVDKVDMVLFMSVNPGFYGAQFLPEVLKKIKEFKKFFPDKIVGIDGGIKLDNIRRVWGVGIDYIYVGSAILKSKNPKDAYKKLLAHLK